MSSKLRNCLPMFDATCLLYGGLNHVMFLFLLFFCLLFWLLLSVGVGLYSNLKLYPLFLGHLGKVGLPFGIFFHWMICSIVFC